MASFLIENLDFKGASIILEAGCGKGQLTTPLVKKLVEIKENLKVIALDLSAGPYQSHLEAL